MELGTANLASGDLAPDMSVFSLFSQADTVIKVVMVLLIIASLVSWTITFDKIFTIGRQYSMAKKFEHIFWSGQVIDKLYDDVKDSSNGYMAMVFVAGIREYKESIGRSALTSAMIMESVASSMRIESSRVLDRCERNIDYLANIGSSAPFIGLFGTVLGIMNSFQSIALTKNTTLAVVAPGIAEALLATAMGLIVAIPSVFFYNRIADRINRLANRIENFSAELLVLLAKEIR